VDGERAPALLRLGDQSAQQAGAEPAAAVRRRQRDVHDADLAPAAVDVEPSRRLAVDLDDVERRVAVMPAIVRILRLELLREERGLLLVGPGQDRELIRARRGIDVGEERPVGIADRAQRDLLH